MQNFRWTAENFVLVQSLEMIETKFLPDVPESVSHG